MSQPAEGVVDEEDTIASNDAMIVGRSRSAMMEPLQSRPRRLS
jgi:hypothetical protein